MRFLKRLLLPSCVFFAALFSLSFITGNQQFFEISKQLDIFVSLFRELNIYYVDKINDEKLIRKAIDAMLESLDPYTEFYPETELDEYKMRYVSAEYGGVGALIQARDGQIMVSETYEGYPAQQNDIRAGDIILEVDGKSVKDFPLEQVSERLKGKPGTKVKVLIKRQGETKPIEKTLFRQEIKFGNVTYTCTFEGDIGYIRLERFLNNSYSEFRNAFQELKRKGIKKLIIDLRGNGGGILQEAVQIVNLFVPKGELIVSQKGKLAEMNSQYRATSEPLDPNIPIVVLVDTASASASEIMAGALQDLDRGVVIGQRTFGKGLVQQTKQLAYNAQLKITIAKYYTPSGRCVQALNFTKKDAKGKAKTIPDSLINEFKTRNNRSVYDGSGIFPDIKMDLPHYSPLLANLISKNVIFDYATEFRLRHPKISPAKTFSLNNNEYDNFVEFAKTKKIEYQTATMEKFKELKKAALEEKYLDKTKIDFDELEKIITPNLEADLYRFKPEIKEFLENEIVSRYYFQTGRLEHVLFNYDDEVKKAIEVLNDSSTYQSILAGIGPYKYIGKPSVQSKQ